MTEDYATALATWADHWYDLTGMDLRGDLWDDDEMDLGDLPGHPFRGNQWAGGQSERAPDSGSGGGPSRGMVIQSKLGPVEMRPATDDDAARLKALKVPPGWHDVHVSVDLTAAVQAVGKDDADRTVYKRSAAYDEKNAAQKFARGKEFNAAVPKLREQMGRDMTDAKLPEKERESALMLHIIDKTAFRPGSESDTGADKFAYGITTLEGRHVKVDGDKVRFRFRGKDGVLNAKTITDPALARTLEPRLATTGPKEQLFPTASDGDMRDYLHSRDGDFKPKDFRTWHGTTKAMEVMEKMPVPKTEKEFKKAQLLVSKAVAMHLGNTPAVARKSYIDPAVWSPWQAKKKAA